MRLGVSCPLQHRHVPDRKILRHLKCNAIGILYTDHITIMTLMLYGSRLIVYKQNHNVVQRLLGLLISTLFAALTSLCFISVMYTVVAICQLVFYTNNYMDYGRNKNVFTFSGMRKC